MCDCSIIQSQKFSKVPLTFYLCLHVMCGMSGHAQYFNKILPCPSNTNNTGLFYDCFPFSLKCRNHRYEFESTLWSDKLFLSQAVLPFANEHCCFFWKRLEMVQQSFNQTHTQDCRNQRTPSYI